MNTSAVATGVDAMVQDDSNWFDDGAPVASCLHHAGSTPGRATTSTEPGQRVPFGDRTAELWQNYYEQLLVRAWSAWLVDLQAVAASMSASWSRTHAVCMSIQGA